MRLSTVADRDDARASHVLRAAVEAGIVTFDTARAYGVDDDDRGHNERLVGGVVGERGRIVTKGGMRRPDGRWVPDGRARTLRADAADSRTALGRPPDLFLLHAPDPRTPLATSVRALADIREAGDARGVGLSNVNRAQLETALAVTAIDAVEVALGAFDDAALRGGVVDLCARRGILVLAHSPLGGPRRAGRLAGDGTLAAIAAERGVSPAQIVLAWLVDLGVVPLPGAGSVDHARAAACAARLVLTPRERERLAGRLGARPRPRPAPATAGDGEVVLLMGIPGAGKSRAAGEWIARGYERLSRDERGGTLRDIHAELDARLGGGVRRVILDNTYVTRVQRSDAVDVAARHGVPVRCVWLATPLAAAQTNLVLRILDRLGALPDPDELRRSRDPAILGPTTPGRVLRELEPPGADEGFAAIDVVPFARAPGAGEPGVFVAAELADAPCDAPGPRLVFGWRPGAPGPGMCPHPGGPPICWCRPPLPGLPLALARAHGVDPTRSVLLGRTAAHRALADAIGARFTEG